MAYIPEQSFNYGGSTGTLASLRTLPINDLIAMRTNARIAQGAPALAENARQFDVGAAEGARQFNVSDLFRNNQLGENTRQFDVGNTGTNERYYAGLGENARQADVSTGVSYAQMANQQLLAQLQMWSQMMAGLR